MNSKTARFRVPGWCWFLPLSTGLGAVMLAWGYSCAVPRADDWFAMMQPYLTHLDGGSLWDFLHSPGNDSRHTAAQFFHWLVIRFAGLDPRVHALVSVFFGLVAVLPVLDWWRRQPGAELWRWAAGWWCAAIILSPMQWMNWTWGLQICYTLAVAGTLGTVWLLDRADAPLGWRLPAAVVAMLAAVFSFICGWLAFVIGAAMLVLRWWRGEPGRPAAALALWVLAGAGAVGVYLMDWPEKPGGDGGGMLQEVLAAPGGFALFFIQVLGAPFAECWLLVERVDRYPLQLWAAAVFGVGGLLLLTALLWRLWRERATVDWRRVVPWAALLVFGLGCSGAIALARFGGGYGQFQSRYPSFTLWFAVGLLGLLACVRGKKLRVVGAVWLVLAVWGSFFGAWQGWRDAERNKRSCDLLEAAAALRQVFVEPVLVDGIQPAGGLKTIALLDRLDGLGLLRVTTVKDARVAKATLGDPGTLRGELRGGSVSAEGDLTLDGWAMEGKSRRSVPAVAISIQPEGGEETWMGLATRLRPQHKTAEKHRARVLEARIGWAYEPLTGEETSFLTRIPLTLKRAPLPSGPVVFRAYAFYPRSGLFVPLDGEVRLDMP